MKFFFGLPVVQLFGCRNLASENLFSAWLRGPLAIGPVTRPYRQGGTVLWIGFYNSG